MERIYFLVSAAGWAWCPVCALWLAIRLHRPDNLQR
jgi:hypothetical protein